MRATERETARVKRQRSVFDRIRDTRVTPGMLLVIVLGLVAVFLLFTFTDLWYVLFP